MAAISVTSPLPGRAGVVLQSGGTGPHDGLPISATIRNAQGNRVQQAAVAITGSEGVLFSTRAATPQNPLTPRTDDDLTPRLATTAVDGALPPVYAFFTRAGLNQIVISAGGVDRTVRVIAPNATDPYRVSVGDVTGNPGARLVVMGLVLDAFGNPVPNLSSGLSLNVADPALGELITTAPATDISGMFSTAFRASDTTKGETTMAVVLDQKVSPAPDPAWLALGGVSLPPGQFRGAAKVTLSGRVRFSASQHLLGSGVARLRGTAEPGVVVDIYAKPAGRERSTRIGSVTANADGNWAIGTTVSTTTRFRARTGRVRTSVLTTVVQSDQTVASRAVGAGRVQFVVHGVPNVKGVVNIYENGNRLAHRPTDRHGDLTTVIRSSPGPHTFRVYFVAPGTTLKGRTVTGTVR